MNANERKLFMIGGLHQDSVAGENYYCRQD